MQVLGKLRRVCNIPGCGRVLPTRAQFWGQSNPDENKRNELNATKAWYRQHDKLLLFDEPYILSAGGLSSIVRWFRGARLHSKNLSTEALKNVNANLWSVARNTAEFTHGAQLAIPRILRKLRAEQFDDLNDVISPPMLSKLEERVRSLPEHQKWLLNVKDEGLHGVAIVDVSTEYERGYLFAKILVLAEFVDIGLCVNVRFSAVISEEEMGDYVIDQINVFERYRPEE